MKFSDQQAVTELKPFIVAKLEHISEADSDVLADYVLALLKSHDLDETVKQDAIHNLHDFLGQHTVPFVDELFARVAPLAFVSTASSTINSSTGLRPLNSSLAVLASESTSKKRSYEEATGEDPGLAHSGHQKYNRKDGESERGRRGEPNGGGRNGRQHMDQASLGNRTGPVDLLPNRTLPPDILQTDARNPLAASIALQTMHTPMAGKTVVRQPILPSKEKCRNYCHRGFGARVKRCSCPQCGNRAPATPGKYESIDTPADPNWPGLKSQHVHLVRNFDKTQVKVLNVANSFPHHSKDHENKAILVEGIPASNFEKEQISNFFGQYGRLVDVSLKRPPGPFQWYENCAVVEFTSHAEAVNSMISPKAVFGNRFVRVSWSISAKAPGSEVRDIFGKRMEETSSHRNTKAGKNHGKFGIGRPEEADIDLKVVKMRQAMKQADHEERKRKFRELRDQREEILRKTEELQRKHDTEKAALLAKIEKKEGVRQASKLVTDDAPATTNDLRMYLNKLEAEARSKGIDPDAMSALDDSVAYHRLTTPGSRSVRGGEGRVFNLCPQVKEDFGEYGSGRGSSHCKPGIKVNQRSWSRGACQYPARASAVMRLDNRPKSLFISGENLSGGANWEGKLRSALLQIGVFEDIRRQSQVKPGEIAINGVIVNFRERWQAEVVLRKLQVERAIQGLGHVKVQWVATPAELSEASTPKTILEVESDADEEEKMDVESEVIEKHQNRNEYGDLSLDVAGEDEWDLIT